MKDWYRIEGGRNHLADFSRKGLTDFSLTSCQISQWVLGGLKIKNYDTTIKLHCICYIDDVRQLKQRYVLKTVKVHVLRFLKKIFYVTAMP